MLNFLAQLKDRQKSGKRLRKDSSGDELLARYMAIKGAKLDDSKKKKKRKLPDDDKSLLMRFVLNALTIPFAETHFSVSLLLLSVFNLLFCYMCYCQIYGANWESQTKSFLSGQLRRGTESFKA